MKEKMKGMSEEEIKKMLENDKNDFLENKTKINGVWVDDENGEVLGEEKN